jgi:Bacteriocin-protection, YdeI or OmpD-Associated/Domain of unknown function (DUF1905)
VRIRSRMEIVGVNPYVLVDARTATRLKSGWRRPMPVAFQVDGLKVERRINLMPIGDGSFRLHLNGAVRKASRLVVGGSVSMSVRFDKMYRGGPLHPMPPWFRRALSTNGRAKRGWDSLPPSLKKEMLRYFANLKSPGARRRNLFRALHVLGGGRARFMGRSWNADRGAALTHPRTDRTA